MSKYENFNRFVDYSTWSGGESEEDFESRVNKFVAEHDINSVNFKYVNRGLFGQRRELNSATVYFNERSVL